MLADTARGGVRVRRLQSTLPAVAKRAAGATEAAAIKLTGWVTQMGESGLAVFGGSTLPRLTSKQAVIRKEVPSGPFETPTRVVLPMRWLGRKPMIVPRLSRQTLRLMKVRHLIEKTCINQRPGPLSPNLFFSLPVRAGFCMAPYPMSFCRELESCESQLRAALKSPRRHLPHRSFQRWQRGTASATDEAVARWSFEFSFTPQTAPARDSCIQRLSHKLCKRLWARMTKLQQCFLPRHCEQVLV